MTKDTPRRDDEFLVQHLVDPNDWVADHERALCHVCTRAFSTFRRKHHCRMCGEVVCSNCTLHKNAMLATIGYTRVRVCMSCVFNHAQTQKMRSPFSPRLTLPESPGSLSSQQWVQSHLHSPLSHSDESEGGESLCLGGYDNQHESIASTLSTSPSDGNQQDDVHTYECSWDHPWPKPPVPDNESERLDALRALDVLDSPPEKPFDMICDLAKARLSCPMAAVSFMDEHRQWFKASVGLAHKMIPRKIAFCAYTVWLQEPVVVLDTLKDKRFERNPLVSGAAEVRFYAAAPVVDPNTGHVVGSVFVLDTQPRESCDVAILERLAYAVQGNLRAAGRGESKTEETPEKDEEDEATAAAASMESKLQQVQRVMEQTPVPHDPATAVESSSALVATTGDASAAATTTGSSLATVSSSSSAVASNEQMEVLLMRLLTQNTETQQQLASQQISMSHTLGYHSQQINKLMCDFARMEAKMEAKIKTI